MKKQNIAFYFGTFNPVHIGHLELIKKTLHYYCDKVCIILTPDSPDKIGISKLPEEDRYNLLNLAIKELDLNKQVFISTIEFNLPKPNYTYVTLQELDKNYPPNKYNKFILMGSDNYISLDSWENSEYIKSNYRIITYIRDFSHEVKNSLILPGEIINISSTNIRNLTSENLDDTEYLLSSTKQYLKDKQLCL